VFGRILHRPALAIVLSLILMFLGGLAIATLPVSQFPSVAPPLVQVAIAYPGASAKVLEDAVLIPLERSINGVQGMKYMISDATSAGEATIQVVFHQGIDPNAATVNVQNRVNQVITRLPPLVQREGVIVSRIQPQMLMYVNLYSTDADADMKFLFNFAGVNLIPELQRIRGVASAKILGSRQYAMRMWLKPDRMRAYGISTEQVMEALAEQSVIGSPGRLGRASGQTSQSLEYVLTYSGRYNTPEQYGDIILRGTEEGEILRLKRRGPGGARQRVLRHLFRPRRQALGGHRAEAGLRQ
jgi:HAE1 family hydrophobic/amphiphilic exporter-1